MRRLSLYGEPIRAPGSSAHGPGKQDWKAADPPIESRTPSVIDRTPAGERPVGR